MFVFASSKPISRTKKPIKMKLTPTTLPSKTSEFTHFKKVVPLPR